MKKLSALLPVLMLLGCLCSCTNEESELGLNIVNGGTRYNGKHHTLTADRALSVRDDSLMTSNYSFCIIGNYQDATFGSVQATLFTQIALPDNSGSINFNEVLIDSVVLTLVKDQLYPDTNQTYNFHFEVMQLAEALRSDSVYLSNSELPVNTSAIFFDDDVSVSPDKDTIRLKLNSSINPVLTQNATADEFTENAKGLRIRLTGAGDDGMLSLNLSATATCLTVYYRNTTADTVESEYPFLAGTSTSHFTQFTHNYTGSVTAGADSIDGSQTLYLEPLAGYNIRIYFDSAIRAFVADHPYAVVHYAELLMPVAANADAMKPNCIIAMSNYRASVGTPIIDYISSGVDGNYNSDSNYYRLRVTRYTQDLLRNGGDLGTTLLLDSRLSNAARTFINGPATTNPIRIELIYSE
ncbi:MAG: DUF4270 family protein [Bacteroidales bacterium]|nr:DUF4270 family protein [Bacteroidales bacterium]